MITELTTKSFHYANTIVLENAHLAGKPFPPLTDIVKATQEIEAYFENAEDQNEAEWLLDQAFSYVNDMYFQDEEGHDVYDVRSVKNYIHHANELKTLLSK